MVFTVVCSNSTLHRSFCEHSATPTWKNGRVAGWEREDVSLKGEVYREERGTQGFVADRLDLDSDIMIKQFTKRRCKQHNSKQSMAPVLRVGNDGSCRFSTVQQAVDAVPLQNKVRTIIEVCPGVYKEPVYVAKTKNFITLRGFCPEDTIISWNNTATTINHHQASQVIGTGTFACGTFIIEGGDFIAENVTFENAAPQGSGQAVAVRVTADCCAFYNCRFLGWQDTLYLHYGKQYLRDCYIEGSVDFIFGNSTALLEHCHIHCKSHGFITAQSRKSSQDSTGYVFVRCVITGTGSGGNPYTYLGRPWGSFARVVFLYTWMDACVKPEGWHNWDNKENEKSACFYQYRCSGPGSDLSERVPWCRELVADEAAIFLAHTFIDPDLRKSWLSNTNGFKVPLSS